MKDFFPHYSIGHFINQPQSKTEFEITRFEEMEEPEVDDIHKHTFYEILWVDSGKSTQTIDYQAYELGAQSLFFISPGQVHQFEEWQPLTGGTILFTADFLSMHPTQPNFLTELSFLDNVYANPNLALTAADFAEVRQTIELLIKEHSRADTDILIVQSLMHLLLSQIQRSINHQTNQAIPKRYLVLFKQFQNLLEARFKEKDTAQDYASALHITSHHLNRVTKTIAGKTASEVIRQRNLLEAKRMLTFTDSTITEIAAELGHFDSSYFAKVFKKEMGYSPLTFRESMYEKYRT